MLTIQQTAGFLQRFMPGRDAAAWLENDRRYEPALPFVQRGEDVFYLEQDVIRLVQMLAVNPVIRISDVRRQQGERRHYASERRTHTDRRHSRRAARDDLDRRFAVRPDRRGDLDRRIRGWIDRRCIDDRRGLA